MKARYLTVAGLAAALAVAGCSSSGGGTANNTTSPSSGGSSSSSPASQQPSSAAPNSASGTLTVWLQVDAQKGWPDAVTAANTAFNQKYPNVKVDVQYQQWNDHLTKFDTQLAAGTAPDVIEMGNTEMAKYMANGAFADLTNDVGQFPNSDTWLQGLAGSAQLDGKTYGVPYYAGARAVIYRTDLYGSNDPSKAATVDDLINDCKAVQAASKDKAFSAFYIPGQYWYMAMGFVYGNGGAIATSDGGKWTGALESSQAQQGLQKWVDLVKACSKAPANTDEAHPNQYQVFEQNTAGAIYDAGWVPGYVQGAKADGGNPDLKGKVGVMAMPGFTADKGMSTFLGGSDLAIPATSKHTDWAEAWVSAFTTTDEQKAFIKAGNLPNTTSLLADAAADTNLAPYAKAAQNSWFTPASKNWVSVEKANVLKNMLTAILQGKSIDSQTKAADQQITQLLNAGA